MKTFLKNLKNNYISLKNNYKINKVNNINLAENFDKETKYNFDIEIKCSNITIIENKKTYDIYDIVNAFLEQGKFFHGLLEKHINLYDIYREILYNEKEIKEKIFKKLLRFILKYEYPYSINIQIQKMCGVDYEIEDIKNRTIMFPMIDYIRDCLVIYHLINILKNFLIIFKEKEELKGEEDYEFYSLSKEEAQKYLILNFKEDKYKKIIENINTSFTILKVFLTNEIEENVNYLRQYSSNKKREIYSAISRIQEKVEIEDIINCSEKWQEYNKFIEIIISSTTNLENIGNIIADNMKYKSEEDIFISQLSSDSLMAVAYYGIQLRYIGKLENIGICQNPDCYNLYVLSKNQRQCNICKKNKISKKSNDLKHKKKR